MFEGGIRGGRKHANRGRLGQVVVEMLLILPVFLTIIFSIMEMGRLAFWVIVLNHSTYEVARIGALHATGLDGGEPINVNARMNEHMRQMIPSAVISSVAENTVFDRQAGVTNNDLVVTGVCDVRLVFPISSILLASPPSSGRRSIRATVRMPIERPLQK